MQSIMPAVCARVGAGAGSQPLGRASIMLAERTTTNIPVSPYCGVDSDSPVSAKQPLSPLSLPLMGCWCDDAAPLPLQG